MARPTMIRLSFAGIPAAPEMGNEAEVSGLEPDNLPLASVEPDAVPGSPRPPHPTTPTTTASK